MTLQERQLLARKIDWVSSKASLNAYDIFEKECPELKEDDEAFDLFCSYLATHLITILHNYRVSAFTHRDIEEEDIDKEEN